jgi:soluble lytic murein transglycosylase-like protein
MSHVIDEETSTDAPHPDPRRHRRRVWKALLAGIGVGALLLPTSDLQTEFFSSSRTHAASRPAMVCLMPAAIAPQITALSRDIGRRFHIAQSAALSITRAAFTAAQTEGIEPTLVLAVAAVESKFRYRALNASTGAAGLMQVVPKWHQDKVGRVGGEPSLLLIAPNITVGTAILAEYVGAEDGNIPDALGHYLGTSGAERYVNRVQLEKAHLERVLKAVGRG